MTARSRLRALAVLMLAAVALLAPWAARRAGADVFGPISLLSASPFGQAEYAHDPAISEDGRYVVFDGSVGGVPGIWRHETQAGASFEQVAGGDAMLPSISADGRYVSFTTNEGASLPALTNGQVPTGEPPEEAPGVYVRDMDSAPQEAPAFTLVSAKDHSTQSLAYEFPGADPEEVEAKSREFGATAAGRSALTADGRVVVFATTAQSDLAGPATPPLQVAVRNLETDETKLVSVRYDAATGEPAIDPETGAPEPVPEEEGRYGAVWSTGGGPPEFSVEHGRPTEGYEIPQPAGASISADGTAVAWLGEQVSQQARTLSGEDLRERYAEPLWRRISAGSLEPTRRVVGGAEDPGCLADPEEQLPATPSSGDPCQGPFATQDASEGTWNRDAGDSDYIPRLSADGDDVAFIATVPTVAGAGGFGLGAEEYNGDAYWEDMTAPDRVAGFKQLTEFGSGERTRISTNANIADIGISPDGQQIAFATKRTVFPLGVPAYVSVPAAVPGLLEMYDVDLADETLTRVTQAYNGGDPEHAEEESTNEDRYPREADGATSPSFSADGEDLVFASTAANLVFGDGNTPPARKLHPEFEDGADAFLVHRVIFSPEPTPQTISAAPPNPSPEPPWKLIVTAASLANGAVQIRATVPASGTLAASATSALPAGVARRGHRKVKRTVARAATTAHTGVVHVQLELKLSGHYRSLASRAGGLPGTVTLTFTARGHAALHKSLAVRFVHRRRSQKAKKR